MSTLPTQLFSMPSALRELLIEWAPLRDVDVVTGPRASTALEGIAISARESDVVAQHFDALTDEGSLIVIADAARPGSGEEAIEAARARVVELLSEVVSAVSQAAGGDPTADGSVLWSGAPYHFGEEANAQTTIGASGAHYYAASVTIGYGARIILEES